MSEVVRHDGPFPLPNEADSTGALTIEQLRVRPEEDLVDVLAEAFLDGPRNSWHSDLREDIGSLWRSFDDSMNNDVDIPRLKLGFSSETYMEIAVSAFGIANEIHATRELTLADQGATRGKEEEQDIKESLLSDAFELIALRAHSYANSSFSDAAFVKFMRNEYLVALGRIMGGIESEEVDEEDLKILWYGLDRALGKFISVFMAERSHKAPRVVVADREE